MNILFYKLLARKELQETVDYLMKSQDFEYSLENQIMADGYNAIEKLKELEDDLDAQLLTLEIYDLIKNKSKATNLQEEVEYLTKLDNLINDRFKHYGLFIIKQIYDYLSTKCIK